VDEFTPTFAQPVLGHLAEKAAAETTFQRKIRDNNLLDGIHHFDQLGTVQSVTRV
jgi:hypothetical protein